MLTPHATHPHPSLPFPHHRTNHANRPTLNINTTNIHTQTTRDPSPSISAISSPSYNNTGLTMVKRHSKSKTATTIPYRNSMLVNDPHKLLTHTPHATHLHLSLPFPHHHTITLGS
eukprot:257081_1